MRELSKRLLINPNTVQKAYKELGTARGISIRLQDLAHLYPKSTQMYWICRNAKDIIEHIRFYIEELYYIGLADEDILRAVGEIIKERGEHLD